MSDNLDEHNNDTMVGGDDIVGTVMTESVSPGNSKCIDETTFKNLLQDSGEIIVEGNDSGQYGTYSDGTRVYKDIYVLAKKLLDHLSEGGFVSLPKNRTNCRRGVAKALIARRKWIGDSENGFYFLDQEQMVNFICAKWSPLDGTRVGPSANDKIRLIGILLSEQYSVDYDIILGNHMSTGNREDIDNPAMRIKHAWARVAIPFNNNDFKVFDPQVWDSACDKPGFDELNPNDDSIFVLTRDGTWLSNLYKVIVKDYKVSFEKYTKGTGGGPGDPADYHDWENRPDVTFHRYADESKLFLTWIYMRDKEIGFKLCSKYDDIPRGIDGNSSQFRTSPLSFNGEMSVTSKSNRTTNISKIAQDMMEGLAQTLTKTMTTSRNNEITINQVDADGTNDVSSKLNNFEKILNQLEVANRLKRTYENLPESTEEERAAKHFRLEQVQKMEEQLLKFGGNNDSA